MTKEEIVKRITEIDDQTDQLKKEKSDLVHQYESMSPFNKGDKVEVHYEDWRTKNIISIECFISGIHMSAFMGSIFEGYDYFFSKMKKDGTQSKHSEGRFSKIIKIELLQAAQ